MLSTLYSSEPVFVGERCLAGSREGNLGQGESRCRVRCLFNLQCIEERGIFLFLPKGSEKGEGDRQVSPFTPSCPRGVPLGLPRGGKGFYVSGVMMLLGPPGPIPRRACCGRCVGWVASRSGQG